MGHELRFKPKKSTFKKSLWATIFLQVGATFLLYIDFGKSYFRVCSTGYQVIDPFLPQTNYNLLKLDLAFNDET